MRALVVTVLCACGRIGFDEVAPRGVASRCVRPMPPDVSAATVVAACDEASVRAAIGAGGVIALDCGPQATIAMTSEIVVTSDIVIDARGTSFDGQNQTRIFNVQGAALTLVNAGIVNGSTTTSGGGIVLEGGALTAFSSRFIGNHAAVMSQSDGGGAIAALPSDATVAIYGSTLLANTGANGGAIKAYEDLTLVGSQLADNQATGTAGQGGAGGAILAAGPGDLTICETLFTGNTAATFGGAIFHVSIDGNGNDELDRVSIVGNSGSGGGAYLQDTTVRMRQVSVALNSGDPVGGLWIQNTKPFDGENLLISDNRASSGIGAGLNIVGPGTLAFSTIANNQALCPGCFAGAIAGSPQLRLVSTVIVNNLGNAPELPGSCTESAIDGGANFQWPADTLLCAAGASVVDPLLGALVEQTGPAGSHRVRTPQPGSPVIGAPTSCPTEDLLGNPRPRRCAAGAVEP